MTKRADIISAELIIILILFSLATIIGCDGDDWGFELFGSTPDGAETANLSGLFADDGNVLFFEWVP